MSTKPEVRFRRRVVLEMLPDENELLQRVAKAHGTMRGALLTGLRLLESDELGQLRATVAELEGKLARSQQQLSATKTRKADQATAAAKVQSELERVHASAREAQAELRKTKSALTKADKLAEDWTQHAHRLENLAIRHLFCASCNDFVPEKEWAEQSSRDGVGIYHEAHDYKEKSGLLAPATVMAWRRLPRERAERSS